MRRVREIVEAVRHVYPNDPFFGRFSESCSENPVKGKTYRTYEDALRWLDPSSWATLKEKAIEHFRDHRPGQLKQGFFNQLNEAFVYRHLRRCGYTGVRMLPESDRPGPDIEYFQGRELRSCEVKTLGISDMEVRRRGSREAFWNVYLQLGLGFVRKMRSAIERARAQIESHSTQGLAYLVVIPDDFTFDNYKRYRREIAAFARTDQVDEVVA